jgi:hypothetical protein
MFDQWLMDQIYGLPPELQYEAYAAMDRRSRVNAARFMEELQQLQDDLQEIDQATMRVGMTARWLGSIYPTLQPDIVRSVVGGQQAFERGFRRAAQQGVDISRFL